MSKSPYGHLKGKTEEAPKDVVNLMAEPLYEYNKVLFSLIDNKIFFCQKVRVLGDGIYKVVGRKFDISKDLQPFLLKKFKLK